MVNYNLDNAVTISNMMSLDNCPKDKLHICMQVTSNQMYYVVNYDKNYVCHNDLYTGLYRSVVFSFPNKKLLAFSPSKSVQFSFFKSLFPQLNEDITITRYVTGIMVQLFYDDRIKKWELATKDYIGGSDVYFYDTKRRNIHDIFVENFGGNDGDKLNDIPTLEYFPKDCSFTFVIDITHNINNAELGYRLYLTSVHCIKNNIPNIVKYIPRSTYKNWHCITCINGLIELPEEKIFESYHDMLETLNYEHIANRYVLVNENTGIRCKIESKEYTVQNSTKKNDPFDYYLFFCLKRINSSGNIYNAYPSYSRQLYNVKNVYENMITNIHECYMDYFVKKRTIVLPSQYEKYLWKIHKTIYLPSIRSKKKCIITRTIIKKFFDDLTPNEQMYVILK